MFEKTTFLSEYKSLKLHLITCRLFKFIFLATFLYTLNFKNNKTKLCGSFLNVLCDSASQKI